MSYQVMVDDNFHYMDEDERYCSASFATAEEAVAHCREIVDEFLGSALKPGTTADELWKSYTMFGEDPFVVASAGEPPVRFSAWGYARERCEVLSGPGLKA